MCKVYGYARTSRKTQNIERQIRNIRAAYPDAIILQEAYTGTKVKGRKEFEKLLKAVKHGDTVIFDSISRMSRNADEGFTLYQQWYNMGVNLVFLKESYVNTDTYKQAMTKQFESISTGDADSEELVNGIISNVNKYMMRLAEKQIKIAFEQAEKEVTDLHQRTKEGIETARLNGKQIGQKPGRKLTIKKADPAKATIRKHCKAFGGTLSDKECMELTGLARNTYYKYKAEIKMEEQDNVCD